MKLAGIDVGTNTLRLLISEYTADGQSKVVDSGRHITRLGEGLSASMMLNEDAMARAVKVLKAYRDQCSEHCVDGIYAVATSAVREAINGSEFIRRAERETGIEINVISGEEEARLTMLGVSSALNITSDDALLMDIGGGSTEFILSSKGKIEFRVSTDIGVVRYTEKYIKSDPPEEEEISTLDRTIRDRLNNIACLADIKRRCRMTAGLKFIGTAGTVTTLAAIDQKMMKYDPEKINGSLLKIKNIRVIFVMLAGMTNLERINLPGVEAGREDLIVAGTLVVYDVMDWFGFDEMTVSDAGLREGLVVDLYQRRISTKGP